jgi:aspartate aminotransferase
VSRSTLAPISPRIAGIAESATLKVDAKAKALKAAGRPIVSYAAGEPDFDTPAHIVEAAVAAASDPRNHHYTAAAGLPELREAVAEKTRRDSGLDVQPSAVIVTNGGKQAVYESLLTLVGDGDEVLVPSPYWVTYPEVVKLAGGIPVGVFAGADQEYRVTVEQLEAARTPRTKVLLFVSPSNPTGSVYSLEETRAIGEWALQHGVWVVTDEIYQNLVYDGVRAVSIVEAVPELAEQAVLVNGVAKTYAMTGWRVGWLIGPTDVVKAATNLQSHATSNVSNVAQAAAVTALRGDLSAVAEMRTAFDRRRRTMVRLLREIPGVECPEPKGAFYCFPCVEGVLGKAIRGRTPQTSAELAELVLDEAEVAVVPGEAFGAPGYFRLSYALGDDDLVEGVTRLAKLLGEAT